MNEGSKYQAYNDAVLSGGYNEQKQKESFPRRGYLSGVWNEPTRKEYVPEDYEKKLCL